MSPLLPPRSSRRLLNPGSLTLLSGAIALLCFLAPAAATRAAELVLDFSRLVPGPLPDIYRPALTGGGPSPDWRIIQVATANTLPPLLASASTNASETVIAQLSEDPTDERFPLLIYDKDSFSDFTATLKVRAVKGRVEQMAGLAFRLQDERNYYVVRASSLGNSFRFYKFVGGVRSDPIGPEIRIPAGEWHTIQVICQGNSIRCRLNERDAIPPLTDTSFTSGKLALWTKSDSVSHFGNLRVTFEAVKTLPQRLVDGAMDRYPRLLGVTVFALDGNQPRAMASTDASEIGKPGTDNEAKTLQDGTILAGTAREHSSALFPVRDRNGDPLFAVRLKMRSFAGQTDSNVAARARPIIAYLEELVGAADSTRN